MITYEVLAEYLKDNHIGIENRINGKKLAVMFDLHDKDIRRLVNEARSEGVPICSCDKGYFYSELPSDILKTVNSLTGRIAKMQTAINGLTMKAYGSMES